MKKSWLWKIFGRKEVQTGTVGRKEASSVQKRQKLSASSNLRVCHLCVCNNTFVYLCACAFQGSVFIYFHSCAYLRKRIFEHPWWKFSLPLASHVCECVCERVCVCERDIECVRTHNYSCVRNSFSSTCPTDDKVLHVKSRPNKSYLIEFADCLTSVFVF